MSSVTASPEPRPAAPERARQRGRGGRQQGVAAPGLPLFLETIARSSGGAVIQRQETLEEPPLLDEEDEELVQAKLRINAPGDAFEQEADRVAETAQRASETGGPGRAEAPRDLLERTPRLAPPDAGDPLPAFVRERVEPVVHADLGRVRVHATPAAHEAAEALGARAFTHQTHIWLGRGESPHDVGLLAHEAAHVVQQHEGGGAASPAPIQRQERGGSPSPPGAASQSFGFSEDEMESRLGATPPEGADTSAPEPKPEPDTEARLEEVESEGDEQPAGGEGPPDGGAGEEAGPRVEGRSRSGRRRGAPPGGPSGAPPAPGPGSEFEALVDERVGEYLEGTVSGEKLAQLDPVTQQLLEAAAVLGEQPIIQPEASALQTPETRGQQEGAQPSGYDQEEPWLRTVAQIRDITGSLGGIVGIIGLAATVSGLILSLLIPPVGAFLLTVGRFCDVAALILDAISLVLSALLTGYNLYRLKNATDPEEKRRLLGMVREDAMKTVMSGIAVATAVAPGAARLLGRSGVGRAVGRGLGAAARGAGRGLGGAARAATRIPGIGGLLARAGRGTAAAGRGAMRLGRGAAARISGGFHRAAGRLRDTRFLTRVNQRALAMEQRIMRQLGSSRVAQRLGGTRLGARLRDSYKSNRELAEVLFHGSQVRHHRYVGSRLQSELDRLQRSGPVTEATARQGLSGRFGEVNPNNLTFTTDAAGRLRFDRAGRRPAGPQMNRFLANLRTAEQRAVQDAIANNPNMTAEQIAELLNSRPNAPANWTGPEIDQFIAMRGQGRAALFKTPHHTISVMDAPHLQFDPRYIQLGNAPLVRTPQVRAPRTADDWADFVTGAYRRGPHANAPFVRTTADAEALVRSGQVDGITDPNYFRSERFFQELADQGNTGRWVNPNNPNQALLFDAHFVGGHRWQTGETGARALFGTYARRGEALRGAATQRLADIGVASAGRIPAHYSDALSGTTGALVDSALRRGGSPTPADTGETAAGNAETTPPGGPAASDEAAAGTPESGAEAPAAPEPARGDSEGFISRLSAAAATSMAPVWTGRLARTGGGDSRALPEPGEPPPPSAVEGEELEPPPTSVPYSPQSLAQIRESRIAILEAIEAVQSYIAAAAQAEEDNAAAADAARALGEQAAGQKATVATERADVAGQQDKLTQAGGAQETMAEENARGSSESERGQGEAQGVQAEGQSVSVEPKPEEPKKKSWLERAWDATAGALWDRLIAPAVRAVRRKVNQVMQSINEFIMDMINQALGLDEIEAELEGGGQDIEQRQESLEETDANLEQTGEQAEQEEERNADSLAQAEANIAEAQGLRLDAEALLAQLQEHHDALLAEEEAGRAFLAEFGSRYATYFEQTEAQEGAGETAAGPGRVEGEEPAPEENAEEEGEQEVVGAGDIAPALQFIADVQAADSAAGAQVSELASASVAALPPSAGRGNDVAAGAALAMFRAGQVSRRSRLALLRGDIQGCVGQPLDAGLAQLETIMDEVLLIAEEMEESRQLALQRLGDAHVNAASASAAAQ